MSRVGPYEPRVHLPVNVARHRGPSAGTPLRNGAPGFTPVFFADFWSVSDGRDERTAYTIRETVQRLAVIQDTYPPTARAVRQPAHHTQEGHLG